MNQSKLLTYQSKSAFMLNQCASYSLITLSVLTFSLFILLCTMPEVSSCEFMLL